MFIRGIEYIIKNVYMPLLILSPYRIVLMHSHDLFQICLSSLQIY
jgi:hypothetical protein